jgi:hypothetical protein
MTVGPSKRNRTYERDRDNKTKLFYLFLIAQICAIFGMVVGVLFLFYGLLELFDKKPILFNLPFKYFFLNKRGHRTKLDRNQNLGGL